jgi:hypothetical protein
MKKTLLLTFCLGFALSVQAGKYLSASISKVIKERAETEWPGDYAMQAYEIKNQTAAFKTFHEMKPPSGMTSSVFEEIKKRAEKEWPKDFEMQLYELKNQIKGWQEVNS